MIFVKNLTEFYQISLKSLVYLTDFGPQLMACLCNTDLDITWSCSVPPIFFTMDNFTRNYYTIHL